MDEQNCARNLRANAWKTFETDNFVINAHRSLDDDEEVFSFSRDDQPIREIILDGMNSSSYKVPAGCID